jgi:lathosterol oxidase
VAMILLHDTWFYFTHRLMHHPKIYRHVHKVHHQSTDPSPFAAFSFHPIEALIDGGVFVVFAFTFPVHMIALWIWQLIHVVLNIVAHLGYEIYPKGFNKHWLFKFKAPATHHNMHHAKTLGNYGFYFTWWDKLLKTEFKDYNQVYDSIHERISNNENLQPQTMSVGELAEG